MQVKNEYKIELRDKKITNKTKKDMKYVQNKDINILVQDAKPQSANEKNLNDYENKGKL